VTASFADIASSIAGVDTILNQALGGSSARQSQWPAVRLLIESWWHSHLNDRISKYAATLIETFPMAVIMRKSDIDPANHVAPLRAMAPKMAISSSFFSLAAGSMPVIPFTCDFEGLFWARDDMLAPIL
jgi:hypothetical protein